MDIVNGTTRFFWPRVVRHREALGVASGCALSFSLYALAQLWPVTHAPIVGLIVGPLTTALIAQRRIVLWGALTNSLYLVFILVFPALIFQASLSQVWEGVSGIVVSQGWFPYLVGLSVVQAVSLLATLPVMLFRSSRSSFKLSGV